MKKFFVGFLFFAAVLVLAGCTKTHTITFETNSEDVVVEKIKVKHGQVATEPDTPVRAGYIFEGWFSTEALEEGTEFDWAKPIEESIKLYAKWSDDDENYPTITFNTKGAAPIERIKVAKGEKATAPRDPVLSGFVFIGWEIGSSGMFWDFSEAVTESLALNARYKKEDAATYRAETYYTSIGSNAMMNPYSETLADSSTLYSLVSDALYSGDYDFEAFRVDKPELADKTDLELLQTHASEIPFNYFPAMANAEPEDISGGDGTIWKITLRDDLRFFDTARTVINAHTFVESYKLLLDPKLNNPRATNLMAGDSLPLVNAAKYFAGPEDPDKDELGALMFKVGEKVYSRATSKVGVLGTPEAPDAYAISLHDQGKEGSLRLYDINHETDRAVLVRNGSLVEQSTGKAFRIDAIDEEVENQVRKIYAPSAGWKLGDVELPVYNEEENTVLLRGTIAYSDEAGVVATKDEYVVSEKGEISIKNGEKMFTQVVTDFTQVGIEAQDDTTLIFRLTQKKSAWQVKTQLASAITSVVHVKNFRDGLIEDGSRTTYGTHANQLVSFGVYRLVEWQEGSFYIFERNEEHRDAEKYRIKRIRYDIIADQSVIVNEYKAGRADVAGVSGDYFATYEKSPHLKLSPVTTIFRFAFGKDRGKDGDPANDNPIVGYEEFRKAIYFAVDREEYTSTVRKPGDPTHGFLGPIYFSSEENTVAYRDSEPGKDVLAEYSPETKGYDQAKAKTLFAEAVAKAVADGKLTEGEKVSIELVLFDAESNRKMAEWLKNQLETTFGKDKFELVVKTVGDKELDAAWDEGNFELTFGGWQGMQFWAPAMLQVYSSGSGKDYMLEAGFETGNAELKVSLPRGKAAVQSWVAEIEAIAEEERTASQRSYLIKFNEFLDKFGQDEATADILTATYDYVWEVAYSEILDFETYEGRTDDSDAITAALEGELMRQMIAVPLSTTVSAAVYSARVKFDAHAFHARMGWGGLKYMSLEAPAQ